ncbi:MAG: dihydropteroate synthase [Desulfobacteraceae bacterium IS3]|nr:MAG: dihydropteroate synthase [Desulfobacteraceae bacterium IS3]
MFLIGESLNVINKKIGKAYKERDPKPIQEEALHQKKMGMDYIDINLGPAKKDGHELMPWVVETVQQVVSDIPLALDTSNISAIEAALKVYKPTSRPPLINSIMCRPERYEKMIPLAAKYNADFIALMWGPDGLPRDENERAALAVELLYAANEAGIANERIWVDGIVTPVNIQQPQLMSLMKFQKMVQDIAPGAKSTCGLSNISNGPPTHLRPILNQTYMVMLEKYGMYSVISDPLDTKLTEIAKGKRQDIVDLIYSMTGDDEPPVGGKDVNIASLSKELQEYAKTVNIILGKALYSDSWLEI